MPTDVTYLDTSGLLCPLPVLMARKTLKKMDKGAILEMQATDPNTLRDFPVFCQETGHELLAMEQHGEAFIIRISCGSQL